jgi:RNA polymerase-binding protein DksA
VAKAKSTSRSSGKSGRSAPKKASSAKKAAKKSTAKKSTAKKSTRKSSAAKKTTVQKSSKAKTTGKKSNKAGSSKAKSTKKRVTKPRAAEASPLTKTQLRELRDLLLGKRRSLVGDMTGIQDSNGGWQDGNAGSMPTHPADIGTDNYEHEFTLGLLESERALLAEIDEALERMENGTYGVCQGTGQPIGYPRLRARPWAKYCIDYARKIEKGLVRPGEPGPEAG